MEVFYVDFSLPPRYYRDYIMKDFMQKESHVRVEESVQEVKRMLTGLRKKLTAES